jgi:8-oxo-dGTP pyrophosphatase MutT (NUDIX family)
MKLTPEIIARRLSAALDAQALVVDADAVVGDEEYDLALELNETLIPAAVLVPMILRSGGVTVLLTKRADHLADHAGQISFPGGRVEAVDEDARAASLRELEEETGIAPDRVRILGQIEDHATVTGFLVTPIIGMIAPPIDIHPDPQEVAEVFECPLSFALDPANFRRQTGLRDGRRRHFYELIFEDRRIWGFTARILVRLSGLLWSCRVS